MVMFDSILSSPSGITSIPSPLPNLSWISTRAPAFSPTFVVPTTTISTTTTTAPRSPIPLLAGNSNDHTGRKPTKINLSWHNPLWKDVGNGCNHLCHGTSSSSSSSSSSSALFSSPLDDFLGNIFGSGDGNKNENNKNNNNNEEYKWKNNENASTPEDEDDGAMEDDFSLSSFQKELDKRQGQNASTTTTEAWEMSGRQKEAAVETRGVAEDDDEFTGYDLRDVIFSKYGECFDVEFQRVDSYGFRTVYLNILPFRLGGRKFRHETEYDYLCHLQAVVEILVKYNQLDYVMAQLFETNKKPRAGTSPLVAVPLRLNLTPEQVDKILG